MLGAGPARLVAVAAIAIVSLLARTACAQQLTVAGDRFAIDGSPRFLTFISYFGAMGAADLAADLQFLKDAGFDGVRIWPNSPEGPQLMRGDGRLDAAAPQRLTEILNPAPARPLLGGV